MAESPQQRSRAVAIDTAIRQEAEADDHYDPAPRRFEETLDEAERGGY